MTGFSLPRHSGALSGSQKLLMYITQNLDNDVSTISNMRIRGRYAFGSSGVLILSDDNPDGKGLTRLSACIYGFESIVLVSDSNIKRCAGCKY